MKRNQIDIVIITHKLIEQLKHCIKEINFTLRESKLKWTLTVIDNCATKEIKDYLADLRKHQEMMVVTHTENLDFSRAYNEAIKYCEGEYLLLLNDDTLPTRDWLEEMIATMERHSKCAVVGAKLMYPHNGAIQHAGVCFDENKKPYHILHNASPFDPRVNIEREFQSVTGACMLVKREVWNRLEGFTEYPIDTDCYYNYEDVDFCMRIKKAGYQVWYSPKAKVFHFGSMTNSKREHFNPKDNFKYLPRLQETWKDSIVSDSKQKSKMPEGIPQILIGIPISEHYDWCLDTFLNSLINIRYWHGAISIIFATNNSGHNFCNKLTNWGKREGREAEFKSIAFASKIEFCDGHEAIVKSRNLCLKYAKENKFDYLWFVDCDVINHPDNLKRLMDMNNEGISAGVVAYKDFDSNRIMLFKLKNNIDLKEYENKLSELNEYDIERETHDYPGIRNRLVGCYRTAIEYYKHNNGDFSADASGMGCTLLYKDLFDIPFRAKVKGFGSEDLSWFIKANQKGYKVKVNKKIKLHHLIRGGVFNA